MTDNTLQACFESERAYLRELGREFSERYPDLGSMLGDEHSDPSVERLLQGFAFLTARIRARLDDDIPELSQRILRQLCPQLLRPVPSMVIQRYDAPTSPSVIRIPAGSWVSQPRSRSAESAPECRFRTIWDVDIHPWTVSGASIRPRPSGSTLRLDFRLNPGAVVERAALSPGQALRVYLHGEDRTPLELMFFLHRGLVGPPRLGTTQGGATSHTFALPPPAPVGLEAEDALLDGWGTAPLGWRVLFEYFMLVEKFLFVDILGLEQLKSLGAATDFFIEFYFTGAFPAELVVSADNFRLACTPAVNLFAHSGAPVHRLPLRSEYRVLPESADHRAIEIYAIEQVSGVASKRAKLVYMPVAQGAMLREGDRVPWYDVQIRAASVVEQPNEASFDPWITLSLPADIAELTQDEKLTFMLTCCNGFWPRALRAGDLSQPRSGSPRGVTTQNLRRPTRRVLPPLGERLAWRVVAALGLGRQDLSDPAVLVRLMDLLNLRALDNAEDAALHIRRTRAIRSIEVCPDERLVTVEQLPRPSGRAGRAFPSVRIPVRGLAVILQISYADVGGVGACFVLGLVLDRVLASLTGISGFSALTLVDVDGRHAPIAYAPRVGERVLA